MPLLPEVQARRYRALAVNLTDNKVTVAMSDPADLSALDAIAALLRPREMGLAVAREGQLLEYFDRLYRRTREIESFAEQLHEEYQDAGFELGSSNLGAGDEGEAVAKLLRSLFEDAVQVGPDIHIEPDEKVLRIRQRIDGILHENILSEVRIAQALVLRLAGGRPRHLREAAAAGWPLQHEGARPRRGCADVDHAGAVRRIRGDAAAGPILRHPVADRDRHAAGDPDPLPAPAQATPRHDPGDGADRQRQDHHPLRRLSELNQASQKIITVEDPVEYRLPRVNQVQVNPKIGPTFSHVLRSTLRQDPDILLVGEMRDNETVEIGLRGAITGHLVLTTLHTNDAVTSALRLIDMGPQVIWWRARCGPWWPSGWCGGCASTASRRRRRMKVRPPG